MKTMLNQGELQKEGYEKIGANPELMMNYHFAESMFGCPAHWHEHIELLRVCRGTLTAYVQGNPITAQEGDLIVINSGQIHAIPPIGEDMAYECLIPHTALCIRMGISMDKIRIDNLIRDQKFNRMYQDIMQELREEKWLYKTSAQIHLLALLIELIQDYGQKISERESVVSGRETMAQRVIAYIGENYAETISTVNICNYLGFDESYVCHNFRKVTGSTILEHLNRVRSEHARELLLTEDITIMTCAQQCGFQHLSYFVRTYKRYIGELPSETAKRRLHDIQEMAD